MDWTKVVAYIGAAAWIPHITQWIKKWIPRISYRVKHLEANGWLAILTALIVIANFILIVYTHQTNIRAEKLFIGQNQPLVDVTPIGVKQVGSQAMTLFSVVNYSGFKAVNIGWDLKYGDKNWILEWRKARDERGKKGDVKGVAKDAVYLSRPEGKVPELGPGETIQTYFEGEKREVKIGISGDLDLESSVCAEGQKGLPVLIRVTWENEHGHVFDEIHEYALVCTKDADNRDGGDGRSFTFIPKGILSKKY